MFDDPNVVLHCEKIDKIYPGTKALDGVSFDVLKGKVNVLIGENGAGKSTLMKMIAGIEQPSNGKMYMGGQEVYFKDTNVARKNGVGIIHQELSLFPNMNIYQNIFIGRELKKNGQLDIPGQKSPGAAGTSYGPFHDGRGTAGRPAANGGNCPELTDGKLKNPHYGRANFFPVRRRSKSSV